MLRRIQIMIWQWILNSPCHSKRNQSRCENVNLCRTTYFAWITMFSSKKKIAFIHVLLTVTIAQRPTFMAAKCILDGMHACAPYFHWNCTTNWPKTQSHPSDSVRPNQFSIAKKKKKIDKLPICRATIIYSCRADGRNFIIYVCIMSAY